MLCSLKNLVSPSAKYHTGYDAKGAASPLCLGQRAPGGISCVSLFVPYLGFAVQAYVYAGVRLAQPYIQNYKSTKNASDLHSTVRRNEQARL